MYNIIYIYMHTVDIEGLVGFTFRRVDNKFHLGLVSIVYSRAFVRLMVRLFSKVGRFISLLRYK